MINREKDSIEYVVKNQNGNLKDLREKISDGQIVFLNERGFIKFDGKSNYKTTSEATEFYVREYGLLEEKSFLGLRI